jgi:hypothetical protein
MRKWFLHLSLFLTLIGCREAQEPVNPVEAPVISNLMITPDIVCAGSGAQVTFLVSDPNGDRITWNAEMNTTQHGNIEQTTGTEASGTVVSIRFKAASGSGHRHRVTLKVEATDEGGTKAQTVELIFSVFSICSS